MFNCNKCRASTPDECARRHEAQLALHRTMEFQRGAMHQAIDKAASKLADSVHELSNASPSDSAMRLLILSPELMAAARRFCSAAREIKVMVESWKKP
jgi:hypothetical protein